MCLNVGARLLNFGKDVHSRQIDCEQICNRINQQLIAGHYGHEGLCQLCTKPPKFLHSR